MLINVEENLIEEQRNSILIENEIETFLETNEGQSIKADINLLIEMGYEKKMINKIYILLRPENIQRAIDYMTEINGIYQHNFLECTNPKEKKLCFICKTPKQRHLDYNEDNILLENQNNNQINNEKELINIEENIEDTNNNENEEIIEGECELCFEAIYKKDKNNNSISCGHLYCNHCWFNYFKSLISESKVDDIKCMNYSCYEKISEEFILKHISDDEHLVEKYKKFKKRAEIFKDKNKKLCPNPDCDSFLEKSDLTNYVECENGHKYCFECLKSPHGNDPCNYIIDEKFMEWKEGKRVKRCPRCQMYTEKNEGCNHMTCTTCKYQWCWLCEGPYNYGHYDSGKCRGHQFTKADNLDEIPKINNNNRYNRNVINGNYFGLHKIFPCFYQPIDNPNIMEEDWWLRFVIILLFWFFGVFFYFMNTVFEYFEREIIIFNNDCTEKLLKIIIVLMSLSMFAAYQIIFSCILSPFILISLVYHEFFDRIQLFFELY